jgi:hypothetical protein
VQKVLLDAHKKGTKFTVIVADGRPMLEGINFNATFIIGRKLDDFCLGLCGYK